jgi:D-3-phosphoglycerate dehydrogenase
MPPHEFTVLVTQPELMEPGMSMLQDMGCDVRLITRPNGRDEVEKILASEPVDAVLSVTVTLTGAAIRSCPTLRVISKHGVGVDNIDVASATALAIPVTFTPGVNSAAVAELALGLLFCVARRIPALDRDVHSGGWLRRKDGFQLEGATLGLVGYGNIGSRVAKAAQAFGMNVATVDPDITAGRIRQARAAGVRVCNSLEEVLAVSDVVSLHVPLGPGTRGLMGPEQFARMRDGAILINTARGELVDEAAMVQSLRSGRLWAAGLDTVAVEPIEEGDPLLAMDNVVITPHIGALTVKTARSASAAAARNIIDVLSGNPLDPRVVVNPAVLRARA